MASRSQRFHLRVLPLWTLHADQGAVSIAVPQRFDAPDPARLMSGRSPQLASGCPLCRALPQQGSGTTPTDLQYLHPLEFVPEPDVNLRNALDAIRARGVEVSRQLYLNSWDH